MFTIFHRTIPFALAALAVTIFAPGMSASTILDVTIQPVTVSPGQMGVPVLGTVTNNAGDIVFINGDNENLAAAVAIPGSIGDLFLAAAPLSLAVGATTGPMELFTFDVPAGALLGSLNAGAFQVLGGIGSVNQNNFDVVGTANVQVTVTPEPDGLTDALIGFALLGIAAATRTARRRMGASRPGA